MPNCKRNCGECAKCVGAHAQVVIDEQNAEIERWKHMHTTASEGLRLALLQVEAMQKIVDAALAWDSIPTVKVRADARALDALITAVDQYRMLIVKRNHECPLCGRTYGPGEERTCHSLSS